MEWRSGGKLTRRARSVEAQTQHLHRHSPLPAARRLGAHGAEELRVPLLDRGHGVDWQIGKCRQCLARAVRSCLTFFTGGLGNIRGMRRHVAILRTPHGARPAACNQSSGPTDTGIKSGVDDLTAVDPGLATRLGEPNRRLGPENFSSSDFGRRQLACSIEMRHRVANTAVISCKQHGICFLFSTYPFIAPRATLSPFHYRRLHILSPLTRHWHHKRPNDPDTRPARHTSG